MKADVAAAVEDKRLLCGSITDCLDRKKMLKEMLELDYKFVSEYFDHHSINFRTWKYLSEDAVANLLSPGFLQKFDELLHQ